LDPNTALLEYSLGVDQSYLWVVTQDSLKTYKLPPREQIQKSAQQVYESLNTHADAQFRRAATELGQMILAPAVAELKGKRLIVVADGALQYVPFAALPVNGSTKIYRPLVV